MALKTTDKQDRLTIFNEELNLIKVPRIRRWTEDCLLLAPDYMFEISASDSGFYHPPWALGPGGLVRHIKAVTMLAHMMSGTFYSQSNAENQEFSKNDGIVSAILSACILHDSCKYGVPFDNRMSDLHPYIPRVYFSKVSGSLTKDERNYIFALIESHMGSYEAGSWSPITKLTKDTLASNPAAMIVHTADYLASRDNYVDARFINLGSDIAGREAHKQYDPFPDHIIHGLVYGVVSEFRPAAIVSDALTDGRIDAICSRVKSLRSPKSTRTSKYNWDGILESIHENLDLIIPPATNEGVDV